MIKIGDMGSCEHIRGKPPPWGYDYSIGTRGEVYLVPWSGERLRLMNRMAGVDPEADTRDDEGMAKLSSHIDTEQRRWAPARERELAEYCKIVPAARGAKSDDT